MFRVFVRRPALLVAVGALTYAGWTLLHFPWDVDPPVDRSAQLGQYYAKAYQQTSAGAQVESTREQKYVQVAKAAAKAADIEGMVNKFVQAHGLAGKKVLDVGSGRGYLQDLVADYTGLDISPTVGRFYHKPFVLGSATDMPFRDNTFDAVWTIWALEHIPNPESALTEIRRVLKPGGVLLLAPAWMCPKSAAQGYAVRPYSDFSLGGKLVKASVPLVESPGFRTSHLLPARTLRLFAFHLGGPLRLRYHRLDPNYEEYWINDSDAVNSIDALEARLWFESRGDECVNCRNGRLLQPMVPLEIQVNKVQGQ